MAKVFIEEETLTKIGNSIRNKTGKTDLIDPAVMDLEIDSITTGGVSPDDLPAEAFNITGNCKYRFSQDNWSWYLNTLANRITTKNLKDCSNMFDCCYNLKRVPIVLNVEWYEGDIDQKFDNCFYFCTALEESPKIRGTLSSYVRMTGMFQGCYCLRNLDDVFTKESFIEVNNALLPGAYYGLTADKLFQDCCSLRTVPTWLKYFRHSEEAQYYPTQNSILYNSSFSNCQALDEIVDMPVWRCHGTLTNNAFGNFIKYTTRLKNMTFETQEDGTPYEVKWKGQTIDFTQYTGWAMTSYEFKDPEQYNSGITNATKVTGVDTYEAYKNSPDWWTQDIYYSRYNHDSAVATINSLPDTSAYLASAGGTNTIKFKGAAGGFTDGGAISNLTAEEIAVATAKGWTVSLV